MAVMVGKLDRLAQFRRAKLIDDGLGMVKVWENHGTPVHAGRQDISDAEKIAAGAVIATVIARFTVRHSSFTIGLTAADRLHCDGADWGIIGIKEVPQPRRRWLEITATRLTNA